MTKHIVITGPQRTGKSFMLEVCTRLGMDTGFTVEDFITPKNRFFEFNFWGEHYLRTPPYIIKHARLASCLEERASIFRWKIEHVYIFIRDIDDSIKSTMKLNRGDNEKSLRRRYYDRLGKIIYQCHRNKWSYSIMDAEKMFKDWRYLLLQLQGFLPPNLSDEEFKAAWKETRNRRKK